MGINLLSDYFVILDPFDSAREYENMALVDLYLDFYFEVGLLLEILYGLYSMIGLI